MARTSISKQRSQLGDSVLKGLGRVLFHVRAGDLDDTFADGAQVTSWVDNERGYTWVGTGASKPVLVKNYANGNSCVRTSGSNYFALSSDDSVALQTKMGYGISNANCSTLFVAKLTTSANSADLPVWTKRNLNAGANGGVAHGFYGGNSTTAYTNYRTENNAGNLISDFRSTSNIFNTLVIGYVGAPGISHNGVNQAQQTVSYSGAGLFEGNTAVFTIGALQGGGTISYTAMDLCELIVYHDNVPLVKAQPAIGVLATKYGITLDA